MAQPSVLSEDQVSAFLNHIGLPLSFQQQRYTGDTSKDIHFLTQLSIHMISTVPYENLWLHYNSTHTNTIDPQDTFTSIVTNARGRGGYCFQVSIFFNHILRGLGFPAYLSPVRIRQRGVDGIPQGNYRGWVHLVNIITLTDGSKYALDVGFGGDGPTAPMHLVHNHISTNLGNQEVRLWHDWIPAQLHRTEAKKLWIYQYRNSVEHEWNSFYAFGETEAMVADFYNLNWYTGSHPESFQTFTCIIVKFLRREKGDGSGDQEIFGKRMLVNGVVKGNLGGKTAVREDCKTEQERVRALETWFGIRLTEEKRAGIRGWGTELKGDGSEGIIARQAESKEVWQVKRGTEWRHDWKESMPV